MFSIIFTTQKRSLGQGNIFTHVCHSVHGVGVCVVTGGMHGCGGVCVVVGGGMCGCQRACMVVGGLCGCWGMCGCWGVCMVMGGVSGCQGVWLLGCVHGCGGHVWLPGGYVWLPGGGGWGA